MEKNISFGAFITLYMDLLTGSPKPEDVRSLNLGSVNPRPTFEYHERVFGNLIDHILIGDHFQSGRHLVYTGECFRNIHVDEDL